ncbi:MAG: DsrE family protein [Actinomycetota bacterium]
MSDRMIFTCTYGKEEPERATLPFVAANVAATAGQQATVVCSIEAVWTGTTGGADGIQAQGLPALSVLYTEFVEKGGEVWLCQSCAKPRGITDDKLAKGAAIVGAAKVIEELASGAKAVNFA